MSQYSWTTCPPAVETQIKALCQHLQAILGTNLVGIYLHGSLAMDCFNPDRSDIDLLVVTTQAMTVETKRQVVELLLQSSMAPGPIEISFLVEQDIHPFQHPLPYDLHYSESWRERHQKALANGEWMNKPFYFVLNACRVYAYLLEGHVFSKDEGGSWGLRMLPGEFHAVIAQALDIYRGERKDEQFDAAMLDGFAAYLREHIMKASSPPLPFFRLEE